MKYSLGIDVGGTNIRIGLVDEEGTIIKSIKEKTNGFGNLNELVDQICHLVDSIDYKDYKIEGIGIGVPGPVKDGAIVHYIPNLNIDYSFNLKDMIESKLNIKTIIGNDANVAGLAEAKVGAGKGYNVCQYITMSTGIGGGLVIDDKLITGCTGLAQEVGSMVIKKGGYAPSKFKPKGCIEGEASGTMLVYKAKEKGLDVIHAGQIFELASNNQIAKQLADEFIDDIACFIGSIVAYIEPDVFVLGGGLMKSKDYFLDEIIKKVNDYVFESLKNKVLIKPAKYDQDCGIIGAAMLTL